MRGAVQVVELDDRVDGGKERPVEPAAALGNALGHLIRHVSHCVGGFDVVEGRLVASF
jgi:hypothetical protein